jgi:hypothetical protein
MLSLSLGARCPSPLTTMLGTMEMAAVATADFFKNARLELFRSDMAIKLKRL